MKTLSSKWHSNAFKESKASYNPLLLEFTMVGKGHQALLHSTFHHWCPQTWTHSLPQPPANQQHDDVTIQVVMQSVLFFFSFLFFLM
jgi:hypothetical protein